MTGQLLLDFDAAQSRKDHGQAAALSVAGDDWKAEATRITLAMRGEFQAEDVRALCTLQPASHYAWGGMFSQLAKQGLIEAVGYRATKSVKTHAHKTSVYRVK